MIKRLIIPEDIHKYFYYDESSPTCLRWKSGGRLKYKGIEEIKNGDVAGCFCSAKDGRLQVTLDGVAYPVSAVVYKLVYSENVPNNYVIDHIDGNQKDNRVKNLRIVSRAINSRNCKKRDNNSSGWNGIHWATKTGKLGQPMLYCCATWYDLLGNNRRKYFRVDYLGIMPALVEAVRYRKMKIDELNKLGAGYLERHGL